jgi:hypothetical protein
MDNLDVEYAETLLEDHHKKYEPLENRQRLLRDNMTWKGSQTGSRFLLYHKILHSRLRLLHCCIEFFYRNQLKHTNYQLPSCTETK